MDYLVTDFGAVGDGKTLNTESINEAISACNEKGGGRVIIPGCGTFISGTIWMKSNVELHIESGAVLLASSNMDDYCADDAYEQNFGVPSEEWSGGHLIAAIECENVSITGYGIIDGNAESFVTKANMCERKPWMEFCWMDGFARAFRPGQTVSFVECRHVRVNDVTFKNLPSWCLFIHGCDYVQICGIKIFNPPYVANTDGIDIDSCRFVTVSDCIVDTGDDAIAIRNASNRLKNKDRISEFVTIINCVLSSSASVFRIGVGSSAIKHIRISNIVVNRGAILFNYCTEYNNCPLTPIYDVNFSNISAVNIMRILNITGCFGVPVKHVTIENVRVESKIGINISNEKDNAFEDITLRNFDIFLQDIDVELTSEIRKSRGETLINANRVDRLTLDGVRLFASPDVISKWTSIIEIKNCQRVKMENCHFSD